MKRILLIESVILSLFLCVTVSFAATISGHVFQEDGITHITGVSVGVGVLSGDPCGHNWINGVWSDSNTGTFTISDIPGGTYFLRTDPAESNYVSEWWAAGASSMDCNNAEPISVTIGQTVSGYEFQLEEGGLITGKVTDAGNDQPIADVWVSASIYDTGQWGNGANTDDQGNFTIQGLPAGVYRVGTEAHGLNFLDEFFEETHEWEMATRIEVTAGETTDNIDMKLDYGFSHEASVINFHKPDGTFASFYFFDIHDLEVNPPGYFTSVTVITPVTKTVHALEWDSSAKEFAKTIENKQPELGIHTFTAITSDGRVVTTDYQYVNKTIPIPAVTAMLPAEGTIVTSKTPIFTWEPVELPGTPLYYNMEVVNKSNGERNDKDFTMGTTGITAPVGALSPGEYQWRVIVADHNEGAPTQNAAFSEWVEFTVSDSLDPHEALPAIHSNSWNGLTWTGGNAFACSVKVTDLDGVAYDGSSHTLTVTAPDGSNFPDETHVKKVGFDRPLNPTSGYYWLYVGGGTPVSGKYTFTVTDPEGLQTTFVEQVDVTPLNGPDAASLTPSNIDEHITATFDNVYVNGQLYEAFNINDINELDPSKWKWISQADIVNNQLVMNLQNSVGRAHGGIAFADVGPITSVQADISVTGASDAPSKGARIAGTFFNDGSNADFWVSFYNNGSRVFYNLSKQWINHQGTYQWETIKSETLVDANVNDIVTMSVVWDEGTKTLTFSADNKTQGLVASEAYEHAGPVYPPIRKELGFHTRINLSTSTNPTFSWDSVTNASRYQFRIYTYDKKRTVWRGYTGSETTYTVPPGVLEPGGYYRYRVEAYDKPSPLSVDNYSRTPTNSDYYRFYTNEEIPERPSIDLDGAGALTYTKDSLTIPIFWVRVNDRQGVPGNITSVKVKFPSGTEEILSLDNTDGPTRGYYLNGSDEPIESGKYTFTVTDNDGHVASITDDLVNNPIPSTNNLSAIVKSKEILVSWDPVTDARFYRIDIHDMTGERLHRISVDAADGSSFAVPRGLLKEGETYSYCIRAYREWFSQLTGDDTQGNFDNSSKFPSDVSLNPTFELTPDSDDDGISNFVENKQGSCTVADDADSDEDGIKDGNEDKNHNGSLDANETDPCNPDTDGDDVYDGTEIGLTQPEDPSATDESKGFFIADADPGSQTDPINDDTDGDGLLDGEEDANHNGRVDPGESDPNPKEKTLPAIPLLLLND